MDSQTLLAFVLIGLLIAIPVWLLISAHKREQARREAIMAHQKEWGDVICELLIKRRIAPDMTKEMVSLSWGSPSMTDQREITKKGENIRWVYGTPRKGARYVWFKGDTVSKIKS